MTTLQKVFIKVVFLVVAIKDYFVWIILVFSLQLIKNYYLEYGLHFNELSSYFANIDWGAYTSSFEVHTFSIVGFLLMPFTMIKILKINTKTNRRDEMFLELKLYNRIFLIAIINIGWIFAALFAFISVVFVISVYVIKSIKMLISFNYILSRIILTIILTVFGLFLSLFFTINANSPYTLFFTTVILYFIAKNIDLFILGLDPKIGFTQKMREKFNIK